MSRSSRKCSWIIQNLAKPPLMRICRGFENWRDFRALSGKFLRQKSCYSESFRFLWLWLGYPPTLHRKSRKKIWKKYIPKRAKNPPLYGKIRKKGSLDTNPKIRVNLLLHLIRLMLRFISGCRCLLSRVIIRCNYCISNSAISSSRNCTTFERISFETSLSKMDADTLF